MARRTPAPSSRHCGSSYASPCAGTRAGPCRAAGRRPILAAQERRHLGAKRLGTERDRLLTAAIEAQIGLDVPSLSLSALDASASLGQSNDGKHNRQVACRFLRCGVIRSPALQGAALETL